VRGLVLSLFFVSLTTAPCTLTVGNATELGKLKLWPQVGATTVSLNLTVIVDNSVVEIYANDEFALTTRVYASSTISPLIYKLTLTLSPVSSTATLGSRSLSAPVSST
jgi:hypothetical protein